MQAPPITPPATLLDGLLSSILTPGTAPGILAMLNGALVLLLAILASLAWVGEGDVHTVVMAALALGLLASVNWFLSLVGHAEAQEAAVGEKEGAVPLAAAAASAGTTRRRARQA